MPRRLNKMYKHIRLHNNFRFCNNGNHDSSCKKIQYPNNGSCISKKFLTALRTKVNKSNRQNLTKLRTITAKPPIMYTKFITNRLSTEQRRPLSLFSHNNGDWSQFSRMRTLHRKHGRSTSPTTRFRRIRHECPTPTGRVGEAQIISTFAFEPKPAMQSCHAAPAHQQK